MNSSHRWRFFRAGGFEQVSIESGEDLQNMRSLDEKLWVALSCPVQGVEFDRKTLECLDSDSDGHIRVPEVLGALDWAFSLLKDPAALAAGVALPLAAINDASEEGKTILKTARFMLETLGKPAADTITVDDTVHVEEALFKKRFNGDGIITPAVTDDQAINSVIRDMITCVGSENDRSGDPGVSRKLFEKFFGDIAAFDEWSRKPEQEPKLLPLGESTPNGAAAFAAVRAKVDDYFLRCELTEYDGRCSITVNPAPEDYRVFLLQNLASHETTVSSLPLAVAGVKKPLPLSDGLHPTWKTAIARFSASVVTPLLGQRDAITLPEWDRITAAFAPYTAWQAAKPQTLVEPLGAPRVSEIAASGARAEIERLLSLDESVADEAKAIALVDRLVRYCRDLMLFANNFVSFRDFYTRKAKAMFQTGTLYLDGRSCDLCVKVTSPDSHAVLAQLSSLFLVYCTCRRKGGTDTMTIAAAFTAGDSDQLIVGRNGVFYDREGRDWDATIVRIIEHPISIRQAFWSPYKRISRMVGEQVQKIAANRAQANVEKGAVKVMDSASKGAEPAKAPAAAPFDVAKFAGIFAAIGLAIGAIGTAIAALVTGLLRLAWWQVPLAFLGIVLIISGPSMALAWFKLRQRNLGPLLDAGGWAVNARARINIPFGTQLTSIAQIPEGAERSLFDPYKEKKGPLPFIIAVAVVLGLVTAYFFLFKR